MAIVAVVFLLLVHPFPLDRGIVYGFHALGRSNRLVVHNQQKNLTGSLEREIMGAEQLSIDCNQSNQAIQE